MLFRQGVLLREGGAEIKARNTAKPEKGRMVMNVEEYNALIAHAKPIA